MCGVASAEAQLNTAVYPPYLAVQTSPTQAPASVHRVRRLASIPCASEDAAQISQHAGSEGTLGLFARGVHDRRSVRGRAQAARGAVLTDLGAMLTSKISQSEAGARQCPSLETPAEIASNPRC